MEPVHEVLENKVFREFDRPTDATTTKWLVKFLCCDLFGNVKKGPAYQDLEEDECITVAEDHGRLLNA